MSKLESIVPALELCKQIPAGEFEDTALVWVVKGDHEECAPRTMFNAIPNSWNVYPAPTMDEILEGIGGIETWDTMTIARITNGKQSLTTNTMKRWFKLKGIEVEE